MCEVTECEDRPWTGEEVLDFLILDPSVDFPEGCTKDVLAEALRDAPNAHIVGDWYITNGGLAELSAFQEAVDLGLKDGSLIEDEETGHISRVLPEIPEEEEDPELQREIEELFGGWFKAVGIQE